MSLKPIRLMAVYMTVILLSFSIDFSNPASAGQSPQGLSPITGRIGHSYNQNQQYAENPIQLAQLARRAFTPLRGFRGRSYGMNQGRRMAPVKPSTTYRPKRQFNNAASKNFSNQLSVKPYKARNTLRQTINPSKRRGVDAHHVVPWKLRSHPVVQKAAKGGFNINGRENGILISTRIHAKSLGHPKYNARVKATLDGVWAATKHKNIKPWQYSQVLKNMTRKEKKFLQNLINGDSLS